MKLFLTALALLLPVSAATITVIPSSLAPAVGESFTADVLATGVFMTVPGEELILFGFDSFVSDPSRVHFVSAAVGPLFLEAGLAGAQVSGFPLAFSLTEGDFTEPLLLATLTFEVLGVGGAFIGVQSDPNTNPDHGLFFLSTVLPIDASARIGPVPEPSTMAMLTVGTLALCFWRRFSRLQ